MKHRWGDPDRDDVHLSVRICATCGTRKLTHHESEGGRAVHWTSFESAAGVGFHGDKTPPCIPPRPAPAEGELLEAAAVSILPPKAARKLTGAASQDRPESPAATRSPARSVTAAPGRSWTPFRDAEPPRRAAQGRARAFGGADVECL